jgi:hypothetical protein
MDKGSTFSNQHNLQKFRIASIVYLPAPDDQVTELHLEQGRPDGVEAYHD